MALFNALLEVARRESPENSIQASGPDFSVLTSSSDTPAQKTQKRKRGIAAVPKPNIPGGPCVHCGATESPQWRRPIDRDQILCNACGIYYGRHHVLPKHKKAAASPSAPSNVMAAEEDSSSAEIAVELVAAYPEVGSRQEEQEAANNTVMVQQQQQQWQQQDDDDAEDDNDAACAALAKHGYTAAPEQASAEQQQQQEAALEAAASAAAVFQLPKRRKLAMRPLLVVQAPQDSYAPRISGSGSMESGNTVAAAAAVANTGNAMLQALDVPLSGPSPPSSPATSHQSSYVSPSAPVAAFDGVLARAGSDTLTHLTPAGSAAVSELAALDAIQRGHELAVRAAALAAAAAAERYNQQLLQLQQLQHHVAALGAAPQPGQQQVLVVPVRVSRGPRSTAHFRQAACMMVA